MSRTRPPHGSPAGFEAGCRTRAICAHDETSAYLSCAEAAMLRRSDYRASQLPADRTLLRHPAGDAATSPDALTHGTAWGYRRGCRASENCPNWAAGRLTCDEARRRYTSEYRHRRLHGTGAPIAHGTANGYHLGCRSREHCPGDEVGRTCTEARSEYRRDAARAAGVAARPETVNGERAVRHLQALRANGHSLRTIARLSGCGRTTITALLQPGTTRTRVTTDTLSRLLSVPLRTPM